MCFVLVSFEIPLWVANKHNKDHSELQLACCQSNGIGFK